MLAAVFMQDSVGCFEQVSVCQNNEGKVKVFLEVRHTVEVHGGKATKITVIDQCTLKSSP